jgi:predicted enzyme related to lactoylglutathione lyase
MKLGWIMGAAATFALAATGAQAQDIRVEAARVGSPAGEVAATAAFYEQAFGLKEVGRFGDDEPQELLLNFGDTADAARANTNAQVVIMARDAAAAEDAMPHLVFRVSDVEAVVDNAVAAGATVDRAPGEFGDTGVFVSMIVDPVGNHIELLQFSAEQ